MINGESYTMDDYEYVAWSGSAKPLQQINVQQPQISELDPCALYSQLDNKSLTAIKHIEAVLEMHMMWQSITGNSFSSSYGSHSIKHPYCSARWV
jgi:hypothetical protein